MGAVGTRSSRQQVRIRKGSHRDKEDIIAMGQASFLLVLSVASLGFVQGCTLKENAKDLISVVYFTDWEGKTAVDRIEVKIEDKGKFVNMVEEGCENPRSKEISVQYRVKGADAEWVK